MPKNPNRSSREKESAKQPKTLKKTAKNIEIKAEQKEIRDRIFNLVFEPEKQNGIEKIGNEQLKATLLNLRFTDIKQFLKCLEACKRLEKTTGRFGGEALENMICVYGTDPEKYIQCAEIFTEATPKNQNYEMANMLACAKSIYTNDIEKLKNCIEISRETIRKSGYNAVKIMIAIKNAYSGNMEKFKKFAEICASTANELTNDGMEALINARDIFGGSTEKFKIFIKTVEEYPAIMTQALAGIKNVYGDNVKKLRECADIYIAIGKQHGFNTPNILTRNQDLFRNDFEKFKIVAETVKKEGGISKS